MRLMNCDLDTLWHLHQRKSHNSYRIHEGDLYLEDYEPCEQCGRLCGGVNPLIIEEPSFPILHWAKTTLREVEENEAYCREDGETYCQYCDLEF